MSVQESARRGVGGVYHGSRNVEMAMPAAAGLAE
jgi:hypothetical protein